MRVSRRFLALSIMICMFSVWAVAGEKKLDQLVDIALENSVDIHVAKADIQAKEAKIGYAKAGYLPQLSAKGEIAQYDVDSDAFGDAFSDNDSVVGASLSAEQLLYDFGGTSSDIDVAKSDYDASLKRLEAITNAVVLSVQRAYYEILDKNQLIIVAKEGVKIDDLQLEQAQEYFKAGVRTKIDVTNAKLQLSNSKLDLLKAEFALQSANTSLITILGIKIDKTFSVKKDNTDISSLANSIVAMKKDSEELVELGLSNRAEIELFKANIKLSQSKISSTRSQYFPKILLNASYDDTDTDIRTLDGTQARAGVYVKWDIFSGFSTQAKVKENLANLTKSKVDLREIELKIIQEVRDAYLDAKKSEGNRPSSKRAGRFN